MGFQQRQFQPPVTPTVTTTAEVPVDQTQDVQGTRGLRNAAKHWQAAVLVTVGLLYASTDTSASGPLPTQPDTWTQSVQGTNEVSQAARQFWKRAAQAFDLYTNTADGQPDTWTSPVDGTAALSRAARRFGTASRQAGTSYYYQFDDLTDGPLPAQPETWTQVVQGTSSVRIAAQGLRSRAVQTLLYWPESQDQPIAAVLDQWTQPVSGQTELQASIRAYRARAVQFSSLLWQTPEDVDGPLTTQPDTWVQPVQGTAAQRTAIRAFLRRAGLSQSFLQNTNDVPAPIEPETWTQSISGLTGLRQQQRAWLRAIRSSVGLWQAPDLTNGPLPTQPDTWVQPVSGTRALQEFRRSIRGKAIRLGQYVWQLLPQDITTDVTLAGPTEFFIVGPEDRWFVVDADPEFFVVAAQGRWFVVEASGPLVSMSSYSSVVLGATPVSHWRLGESIGTTAVDERGTQNGTYTNTPTLGQPGVINDGNTAVAFNGSNQYVSVANHASLNGTFSTLALEVWLNTNTLTLPNGHRMAISLASAFGQTYISLRQSGSTRAPFCSMRIGGAQVTVDSGVALATGSWYHVVGTYDGSALQIYVNGILCNSTAASGTVSTAGGSNAIGDYAAILAANWGWSGTLDEAAIYTHNLTADQVRDHYGAHNAMRGRWITVSADDREFDV